LNLSLDQLPSMTMQTPLSPSPLRILRHDFLEISVEASEAEEPNAPLGIKLNRHWGPSSDDPLRWRLTLTVRFGGEDENDMEPYRGRLRAVGVFEIAEAYPEDKRDSLIGITGASILYGACREMLANLTARGPHGMISLPSISFIEVKPKEAGTVSAKKVARKGASRSVSKKKAPKKK